MSYIILTLLIVGLCLAVHEFSPRVRALLLIVTVLLLIPLWIKVGENWLWFVWVKSFSVFIACVYLFIISSYKKEWKPWPVILLLVVNILEAIVLDVQHGNYFNALVGVLLLILFRFDTKLISKEIGVKFNISVFWVFAYTFWDLSLISNLFEGRYILQHCIVLGVPIIFGFIKGLDLWLYYRAISLGIYFMLFNTGFTLFEQFLNSETMYNIYISRLSTGLAVLFLLLYVLEERKTNI